MKPKIYYDYLDTMTSEELIFIKGHYNWNGTGLLIINYRQPRSYCHFDNNLKPSSKKWWKDYYKKVNTEGCFNIHVTAEGEHSEIKLDNVIYFDDTNDFLLEHFFNRKHSCFAVMVINPSGDYVQYNGHYHEEEVNRYIELLRAK